MTKILFIADFFVEDITGGGELNNEELITILRKKNSLIQLRSHLVDDKSLDNADGIIVANFINLDKNILSKITMGKIPYMIYEHDHKYLKTRNPALYKDYIAPAADIVNFDFYKNARAVVCQSQYHKDILIKNLKLNNIISVGGNIWSLEALEKINFFSTKVKKNACSIMNSLISHKNTFAAIEYCNKENKSYDLINSCAYYDFLDQISNNDTLVFFPKTPETLSRIVVEARMMNMKVITNNLVGATKEEWFKYKGEKLISIMKEKRNNIATLIEDIFNETKQI